MLALAFLFLLAEARALDTEAPTNSPGLFDLSLEDLGAIEVSAHPSKTSRKEGTFVLHRRGLSRLSHGRWPAVLRAACVQSKSVVRDVSLFVDGFEVRRLDSLVDFAAYTKFFGPKLERAEFYVGTSARWWGNSKATCAINIVTKGSDVPRQGASNPAQSAEVLK